jgi:DNA invertase Pin-like site-specific DNA recombinase
VLLSLSVGAATARAQGGEGSDSTATLAFIALGVLTLAAVAIVARRARAAKRVRATGERAEPRAPAQPAPQPQPAPEPKSPRAPERQPERESPAVQAVGYTTFAGNEGASGPETERIGRRLEEACEARGMVLQKLVGDVESASGAELKRPGLLHAQDLLASGRAHCLVVESLDQLSRSAGTLGALVTWLAEREVRFVVVDIELDTSTDQGRLAADALVTVGELERRRVERRTRKGLEAAREGRVVSGRPAVADKPSLKRRIAEMRAAGLTLQAIADVLNAEGVPTLRGGAEWRPSSVQAAAGYKRPGRRTQPGPDSDERP